MRFSIVPVILLTLLSGALLQADEKQTKEKLDIGDGKSSTITDKAWAAFERDDYEKSIALAKKCIELHEKEALRMQDELPGPVPTNDKEAVAEMGALNDVGTCYFIIGQALEKLKKPAEAIKAYTKLTKTLSYSQCWDPKGWYWKPAKAAKKRLAKLGPAPEKKPKDKK